MSWKKLLESVSKSLNDHVRLRNEHLMAENRILRSQIDGRVQLTDSESKELAELGAKLGKKVLEEIATVATPAKPLGCVGGDRLLPKWGMEQVWAGDVLPSEPHPL